MSTSPFAPGFGSFPPALAGRQELLDRVASRMLPGNRENYLLRGHRGMGKTVMLSALEDVAADHGWVAVSATASTELVDTLVDTTLVLALANLEDKPVERTVTGLTIPGVGGISTTAVRRNEPKPNLYTRLSDLLDAVQKRNPDGGVLLTIDEIEKNALNDLGRIGSTIQHIVRENRPIKIVAAGLPQYLNELLNENHTTFLRRAYRLDIGALEWDSARRALHDPIVEGGRNIDPHDLDRATAATHGYPFLTQVIGDEAWRANEGSPQISASDVDTAIGIAGEAMGRMVHEPALRQLSNRERDYLMAVAQFDEACPTSDVADRLGIRVQAGANLRAALEDHGLVYQPERGSVDLAVPFLREHLRTHGPTPRSALVGPAVGFAPVADVNTAALGHPRGVLTPQPDARTTPHSPAPQGQDRASELDRDTDTGPEP